MSEHRAPDQHRGDPDWGWAVAAVGHPWRWLRWCAGAARRVGVVVTAVWVVAVLCVVVVALATAGEMYWVLVAAAGVAGVGAEVRRQRGGEELGAPERAGAIVIAALAGAAAAIVAVTVAVFLAPVLFVALIAAVATMLWRRQRGRRTVPAGALRRGDVWWAKVTYHDASGSKIRPVIVVGVEGSVCEVYYLTSRPTREGAVGYVELDGSGWRRGDKRSFANVAEPRRIALGDFSGRMGTLGARDRQRVGL